MQPSNLPSSTGTTVRRSAASTMINRLAWPQPSSFPQPPVQLTRLSCISSPSLSLTPHLLQSSTLPSSISAYKHPTNLTNLSKCPQMPLPVYQTSHSPRTMSLSLLVRLVKSLKPPMSPSTVTTTLVAHPDLNTTILQAIANGLLSTIAQHEAHTASEVHCLKEQIRGLHDCIEHYKNTFKRAPDGYIKNDRWVPHFYIPLGNGVHHPTKWIKRMEDGRVAGYHKGKGPNESPHIINLYVQADTIGHGKENPIEPLPTWFCALLLGPSSDFVHLQHEIKDLDDWGIAREITWYSLIWRANGPAFRFARCLWASRLM